MMSVEYLEATLSRASMVFPGSGRTLSIVGFMRQQQSICTVEPTIDSRPLVASACSHRTWAAPKRYYTPPPPCPFPTTFPP